MCYTDTSGLPMNIVCTGSSDSGLLDCNNDDYFHTNPVAGSYLASYWNTANSWYLFASNPVDTTAPISPTSLTATAALGNRVTMTWNKSTDASNDIVYYIYRNGVKIGEAYDIPSSGGKPYYSDTTVTGSTTYVYTVTAVDMSGNESAPSNQLSVTTSELDVTPPTVPANVRIVSMTPTTYRYAWDASTDASSGLKYYRTHGTLTSGTSFSMCCGYVQSNTQYTETITAIDNAGNESAPATITFTTPATDEPPTAPQNLRTTALTSSSVTLAWDAATDLGEVEGYQLYKKGPTDTDFKKAGGVYVPNLTMSDTTFLQPGQTYSYYIDAWDTAKQHSTASNTITVTIPILPPAPVPIFRMANYLTGERLFITDQTEINRIRDRNGWVLEGVAFYVPNTGTVPVFRMSNWITHERLFITDQTEINRIRDRNGWVLEGVAFYVPTTGATPVFRMANYLTRERLFITDQAEINRINGRDGWVLEGVAFYVP